MPEVRDLLFYIAELTECEHSGVNEDPRGIHVI
jgi:hypothetical protein